MTQLWTSASRDFGLPVHGYSKYKNKWSAPKLRALYWPNEQVCWEANIYCIWLRKCGLATTTVNTYCSELSRFIRFLGGEGIAFKSVTDETLFAFSAYLQSQPTVSPSANQINRLIARALRFLLWFQRQIPTPKIVGTEGEGAQITVHITSGSGKYVSAETLRHPAMLPRSIPRVVRAISGDVISKLLTACSVAAETQFIKSRNLAMLKLLADSGIRREELVWVKVKDATDALTNGGRLVVRTSKRSGNPKREVPVPMVTLKAICSYIDVQRAIRIRAIRKRSPATADEGWAFCTRSGQRLQPVSITQILAKLRVAASLTIPATAHMFRHRWITLQVLQIIRTMRAGTPLAKEAMATVLTRLASLTGHSSTKSLWTYVDWAFDELVETPRPIARLTADQRLLIDEAMSRVDSIVATAETVESDPERVSALRHVREQLKDLFRPRVESVVLHSLRST